MSTDLRRMSSVKVELTDNSSTESEEDVNRGFREVDEIDGKKFTSKKAAAYNRTLRSNL